MKNATESELITHCRQVAEVLPVVGFYLQPAVGGRVLPFSFWRQMAEIENVVAIKIAPFNRYQTLDVVRAVAEAGREDIALYTGNDDNILMDLLTPFRFAVGGRIVERRVVGGLLGRWAVWTREAVQLLAQCHRIAAQNGDIPAVLAARNVELTDANAAIFDAANGFLGCIAGIHEVLRRQGLLKESGASTPTRHWEQAKPPRSSAVCRAYPHLADDQFVREHLDRWLSG